MSSKKKYIILIVRRHPGEIDWILPLIYRLSYKYELITLFNNPKSFDILCKNKNLYNLWKKKCQKYYVIKKTEKFISRLVLKTFYFFNLQKFNFFLNFENSIISNILDSKKILNTLSFKKDELKAVFTPINNSSSLPKFFKILQPNIKIVRFPESQWINPNKKNYKIQNFDRKIYKDSLTDYYLINKDQNINFYLGYNLTNKIHKKIIFTNFFKYEKWWIKKMIIKSAKTDKNLITIFTRPPDNQTISLASYKNHITNILDVLIKINKIKIIFKINSVSDEKKIILKILKNYNRLNWQIDTNHPMIAAQKSNFCITMLTSACLDCLALNKLVIEYFDYSQESLKAAGVYSNSKKSWISIYNEKKLLLGAQNKSELDSIIKKIYKRKNNYFFKKYNNNFKKLISKGYNSNFVSNKIIKFIED